MPTIKGPMKFNGFNAGEFLAKNAKDVKIKLPFEATGFKSSKTPVAADLSKIKFKDAKPIAKPAPKPAEKPKPAETPKVAAEKPAEKKVI